jgi:hypothetical protein
MLFPQEISKKINPVLFVIHHASNPISHCLEEVIDGDASDRVVLKDHATGTSVAVARANPTNTSFSMKQPTNLLTFATAYVSSKQ